jgi:hypothetical protein
MTLRDRIRRWWRPAQWNDDHPLEARESKGRSARKKPRRMMYDGNDGITDIPTVSTDRDFKKPHY